MKTRFITFLLLFVMNLGVFAQSSYQPTEENLKARQEFQDNKFGIFLHWGLYAMLATGEWTMTNNNLNYKEYAKLAGGFYPSKFDADKWVAAIKASGAKYICFTTRHHEGFSMFDTKYSDYNVVKATPFKRDIVKELAAACARGGLLLCQRSGQLLRACREYQPAVSRLCHAKMFQFHAVSLLLNGS